MITFKQKTRKVINLLFIILAKITKTNLVYLGYYQKGILKHGTDEITGEKFVIEKILTNIIKKAEPIFFDVGSNEGSYSLSLKNNFPRSIIYSFEPNPETFKKIPNDTLSKNINFYNIGLGSCSETRTIYDYKNKKGTQHASIYKEVLTDIHHSNNIDAIKFKNDTLDNFCKINNIKEIDFLKLDTEGSEFDVLRGSVEMIRLDKIKVIQFEFNEMNIISRIFLRDYYEFLKNYNIYRIDTEKIIPLFEYNTDNEIFKYQNFLAINKSL
jgi:FkbM family methyltransferase